MTGPATWARKLRTASGVLVLSYDEATDSFTAAEVAYPDDGTETTSGGLHGGTGPSEVIFMVHLRGTSAGFR